MKSMKSRLGEVKQRRCFLCGKLRLCRTDTVNKYLPKETSAKLIAVCLMTCSTYGDDET